MFGSKSKEKGKSPKDELIENLEQLTPGQEALFHLGEVYGPEIIIVRANADYPGRGHRYAVIGSPPVDGRPGPTRNTIWEANKAKPVAEWLLMRAATPFA